MDITQNQSTPLKNININECPTKTDSNGWEFYQQIIAKAHYYLLGINLVICGYLILYKPNLISGGFNKIHLKLVFCVFVITSFFGVTHILTNCWWQTFGRLRSTAENKKKEPLKNWEERFYKIQFIVGIFFDSLLFIAMFVSVVFGMWYFW